jgi:hypothetical protein
MYFCSGQPTHFCSGVDKQDGLSSLSCRRSLLRGGFIFGANHHIETFL